jgi:hypothetical protein
MTARQNISADPYVVARTALGALRFVDAGTGLTIADGLSVIARVRDKEVPAIPSPSGVYIFHQLPGLSGASFWDGETESVPLQYQFNIEVRDTSRRFLPTTFKTSFPDWPEATPICPGVTTLGNKVPLYSAPWRLPRNDFAIIRGTLMVKSNNKPAAWALLRVYHEADDVATATPVIEGVAGRDGGFLLMFPWPKEYQQSLSGPKGPRWTFNVKALYDLPDPPIPDEEVPDGEITLPKLCSVLKQKPAKLLAAPDTELPVQEMKPGQLLFLKTSGAEKFLLLDK